MASPPPLRQGMEGEVSDSKGVQVKKFLSVNTTLDNELVTIEKMHLMEVCSSTIPMFCRTPK